VRLAPFLLASVSLLACGDDAGPTCATLRDPSALRHFVGTVADSDFAPNQDATRGGPEDDPRVRSRYRRDAVRYLFRETRKACANAPQDYRPKKALVDKNRD
jgi:hypothetical protein